MMGAVWTQEEDAKLAQLVADGYRRKKIAEVLCRSRAAVSRRSSEKKFHRRPEHVGSIAPLPQVTITRAYVIEWYLLGWRFVGFKGDLCKFEWQSEKEPRWPEQMREAA